MALYTTGLKQVKVGDAVPTGTITSTVLSGLTKQFKVYNDTCEIQQDAPSVTEHKEENNAIPVISIVERQPIRIKFQVMESDLDVLKLLLGGTTVTGHNTPDDAFGYDGADDVPNKFVLFETVTGMDIMVPNAMISSNMSGKLSKTGIALIDVEIVPQAVTATGKKPLVMAPKATTASGSGQ